MTVPFKVEIFMDAAIALQMSIKLKMKEEQQIEMLKIMIESYKQLIPCRDVVEIMYHKDDYKELYDALGFLDEVKNSKEQS